MISLEDLMMASARYRAVSGLAWRAVDDEVFVYQLGNRLHILEGPVASLLWARLDSAPQTKEELVDAMVASFRVDRPTAAEDLATFLTPLIDLGLVEIHGDPADGT